MLQSIISSRRTLRFRRPNRTLLRLRLKSPTRRGPDQPGAPDPLFDQNHTCQPGQPSMEYVWWGEVVAGGEGARLLGLGSSGNFTFPKNFSTRHGQTSTSVCWRSMPTAKHMNWTGSIGWPVTILALDTTSEFGSLAVRPAVTRACETPAPFAGWLRPSAFSGNRSDSRSRRAARGNRLLRGC